MTYGHTRRVPFFKSSAYVATIISRQWDFVVTLLSKCSQPNQKDLRGGWFGATTDMSSSHLIPTNCMAVNDRARDTSGRLSTFTKNSGVSITDAKLDKALHYLPESVRQLFYVNW
jgi:hypothetical protein